jgi:N-succinyldiaminopimelate aminotransferase
MPRSPHVARSAQQLSDRVFSRLALLAKERGKPVHPLHVGDTYLEPLAAAMAEAQRTAEQPRLHNYAPVQGEPMLLDAIDAHLSRRAGYAVDRERVQVVSGATAGLSVVSEALLDPGDEVILPSPFWPLIRGIIQKRGAVAVEVPLFHRAADPDFDVETALEAAVTPNTAALYLNSPHNPTGAILSDAQIAAFARVAARHDLWVLSDEVYESLALFGDAPPTWSRVDLRDRTVAVHSVSKAYGLAGSRVGFAHGPAEAMAAIRGVQTYSTYCAPRPLQRGAARVLMDGEPWLRDARATYARAAKRAADALGATVPAAGTFLHLDVRPHLRDGEDTMGFLTRCLEAGVLLTPGASTGRDFEGYVRLCFTSVPPEQLDEALAALAPLFGR